MTDLPVPLIHTGGILWENGNERRPTFSSSSSNNNNGSSSVRDTGHFLDSQSCYGTLVEGVDDRDGSEVENKGGIDGERCSVIVNSTMTEGLGSSSFRVHLTQDSNTASYSQPMKDPLSTSATTVEGRRNWGEPVKGIVCRDPQEGRPQQQQPESRHARWQHQHHESICGVDSTKQNAALSLMSATEKQPLRLKTNLEDAVTQRTRTSMVQKANDSTEVHIRRSLEATLRAREKDLKDAQEALQAMRARLAEGFQREEVLRGRLLVAEETRVLYQLYLQRLLELLCTRAKGGSVEQLCAKLTVTNSDITMALNGVLRSMDAATDGKVNAVSEFTPEGKRGAARTVASSQPPHQLTNATLLKSSMLESTVAECMALWRREEVRQQDNLKQMFEDVVNTCIKDMEVKHAEALSALKKTDHRVIEYGRVAATMLDKFVRKSYSRGDSIEHLQREIKQISHEYAQSQRQLQRAQAEIGGLKEELQRRESDREVAMLVHRAAECLEEVRQSVRNGVRSAAHDIEQRLLESNTLKEPFVQSIRVIALKVEAHAEIARMAVCREQRERVDEYSEAVLRRAGSIDTDEMHRLILSAPRRNSRGRSGTSQLFKNDETEASKDLILEELTRVMKNLCQLLQNNSHQMAGNAAKITQTIADWEVAIVKKMNEIWEFMRGIFAGIALPPTTSAHLAIGDSGTDFSIRSPLHQTKLKSTSSVSGSKLYHGTFIGSSSCAPTRSLPPSSVSSAEMSQATSLAPPVPLWRAPLAPLHEVVEQTPELRTRRCFDRLSPPSIAVSRTPTPPPSSLFSGAAGTLPPTQRPPKQEEDQQNYESQQRRLFLDTSFGTSSNAEDVLTMTQIHHTGEAEGKKKE